MKLSIPDDLRPYVNALAETGVFGSTPEEVVVYLLRGAIADTLSNGGILDGLLDWQRATGAS